MGAEPVALLVRKNSWRDGHWEAAPPNSPSYGLAWADQRVYVYATPQPTQPVEREPVAWKHDCAALLTNDVELWIDACPHCGKPRNAPQPVAREQLPKFLALKFHARRDKKATVTLLFPGHEAADAWMRGIKGGQHVS